MNHRNSLFFFLLLNASPIASLRINFDKDVDEVDAPSVGNDDTSSLTDEKFADLGPKERYFNLSCPFEMSKYSCTYQGTKARKAEWSELYAEGALGNVRMMNRRVIMIGDSYMRQMFISAGCSGISNLEKYDIDWATDYDWPCFVPGTKGKSDKNCIQRGEHSGFNTASLKWAGGGEMHFLATAGSMKSEKKHFAADDG